MCAPWGVYVTGVPVTSHEEMQPEIVIEDLLHFVLTALTAVTTESTTIQERTCYG